MSMLKVKARLPIETRNVMGFDASAACSFEHEMKRVKPQMP
jgi:hypothetical protein